MYSDDKVMHDCIGGQKDGSKHFNGYLFLYEKIPGPDEATTSNNGNMSANDHFNLK